MTVNYISSEVFSTANPTITVPVNCNCIAVLSYSADALTIGGYTPSTKATMANFGYKLFELIDPPTGSQSVSAASAVLRIFVYLNQAATCSVELNDYDAEGSIQYNLASVLTSELVLLMGYGLANYDPVDMAIDGVELNNIYTYLHGGSIYKVGLGAAMLCGIEDPHSGSIPVNYGQCSLVIAKFGTSVDSPAQSNQSNYVTFI
ncbi:MAG: hypothetical protein WC998_08150 [Candidatus Paceibacterota bacterium]|jgi:hypothetical protein